MESGYVRPPDIVTSCHVARQSPSVEPDVETTTAESYLETVRRAATTLKHHTESSVIASSLDNLRECLEKYHKLDLHLIASLENQRIHEDVLICMHNFIGIEEIQTAACNLLTFLMTLSWDIAQDLISKDGHQRIQRILDYHMGDEKVQVAALHTFICFIQSAPTRKKVLYGGGDIVGHLTMAMSVFPESPELQSVSCRALCILFQEEPNLQADMLKSRDYALILTALKSHMKCRDVAREGCSLLHLLTNEAAVFLTVLDGTLQTLIHDRVHMAMISVTRRHGKCEETMVAAYGVLSILSFEEDVLHAIASSDMESDLMDALMKFIRNADIQCHCFTIFANILTYDDELTYDRSEGQEVHWLKQVYIAMTQHRDASGVQVACCRVLAQLLELYPELNENIGEDVDMSQDPLHILCFGALLMHHYEMSVVVAACNAIYWLSADNERIQQQLMQKNAYIGLIHAMKLHASDPSVQAAACRALRGLAIFSQDSKETISWHGDLSDIFRPLKKFPDNLEVQTEGIAVLACLADTELVRTVCFVDGFHERILTAMDVHEGSPLLHEVSLEALSILCAADGGSTVLNESGAPERVLNSMKTHWDNAVIQRKGVVLLQLLLDDITTGQVIDHSAELAKSICAAMSQHEDEIGLQTEGCVAMLLLAEKGEFASIQLVDAQAHAHLFHILQDMNEQKKLVELANECLFVLGCERNLKSQMLQYACAQGLTRGVECLIQLGAEVNVGSGTDTPLCHACCHGDEHVVGLLLRQGVTDLQTALQLTLRMEQHNLAGLILSHCDRHGGIVSWSGLGLEGLRPEWLEPTFLGGPSRVWQVSESGKLMAQRIKKTEEKRSLRHLGRPLSAPATPTRRMSLRFSFEGKQRFGNKEELVQKLQENYPQLRSEDGEMGEGQVKGSQGKGPLARIRRKLHNLRNRRKSSPATAFSDRGSLRTRSELIRSISTSSFSLYEQNSQGGDPSGDYVAEFPQCPDELREWRETTLTGSNVPFSPLDPRISKEKLDLKQPQILPGEWQRKSPFRKSRRRSESFLMISQLGRSSSTRSLRSLSASSHQGIADDSSIGSSGGPSTIDVFSEYSTPPRLSYPRKRATTLRHTYSEAASPILTPIRDSVQDNHGTTSLADATSMGSTSNLLLEVSPKQVVARRCRSVTFGDSPVAASSEKITQLDLSSNSINDLTELLAESHPSLLCRFNNLEKLDLSQNRLKSIPDALFKFMTQLRHLIVVGNQLTHLPAAALNCPHLSIIDLSNNQIEDFSLIANRVTLTVKDLNLSHNSLQTLPQWLAKTMPRLETLNLYGNRISSLPEEPLVLKSLRVLDLSHNHIKVIPDLLLSQTDALETLALSGNEIDVLPSEELASILSKLAVVKLSHNQLSGKEPFFIPKFLLELKSLRSLDVRHNQLTGLPEPSLWKASMLREINASHNSIKKLTLSQARLWPTLERLTLAHNKLNEVPPEIGQLVSLTSLDISHNEKLATIPDEMGRLQKLWELNLDGLKLDLDEGLTRGRTKDIIGYLHEKLKRSVEYYHMKMMVVGYGGRGKSTLLRSLMRQKQPDRSLPTVGVVVRDWTFRGRSPRAGSGTVTYTLSTWDFAGQEEFYSTHQCFLSNRALYLVIYNLSRGPSEVEMLRPWLVNIQARAPNCPVLVVGTHMDTLPRDEREDLISDMRQRISEMCEGPGYPELKGLVEVNSTQESPPLDRLRILVKDVLDNFKVKGQHVMGQKIPESYVKLQELLSEESRNLRSSLPIIKHGRLVKIAKDAELDLDEEELQQAVRFLHESGALLHYDDAALQLNSLYFVDPEWLCRMMAQVVTVREINPFISQQGILRKENVRLLFTGKRVGDDVFYTFPPSLIPQYLRLLERFEIALPQSDEELLVPSRLPLEMPTFIHPLPKPVNHPAGHAPCLVQRHYGLSYTPIGLWSRLLTRLLVLLNSSLPELGGDRKTPQEVSYWREGIYIYYNQESFVLVSSEGGNNIVITAPGTRHGARLLSAVVDHVDILMEEWYPGLLEISPTGESLVKVTVPCPDCQAPGHIFVFEELVSLSDLDDTIDCPLHGGQVPLSLIVPDVVLGDMEERHFLKQEDFTLVQRPEHVLGEGTFGCVYRAQYKKQAVAVKIFNKVGDAHPYKMMRQEAIILRRLHHPSLVGLVGFGLRPRVIALELAPLGSLGGLLRSERIRARTLQQRIGYQVAAGLRFLHEHSIIYRDMKPDNILIYNLSLAVVINAKISDYGISRLATPSGLTLPEGTPGYRGPEVVKGEPYSIQADIYSFGITLYEMVTGGQHPFSELGFRSEVDDAVLKGRRVDPVTKKGAAPWPDMEDLIDRCLHPCPDERPTSGQIVETLKSIEVLSLRRAVAVSKGVTIECMEVRGYGEDDLEVWVASGEKNEAQLSWLSLTSHTQEPKGMMFTGSRILCMEAVGQSHVLLGTQAGTISVYDAWQHCCKHTTPPLPDSILCLQHYDGYHDQDLVLVGLANGQLAIYKTKDILTDSKAKPEFLQVGGHREPLKVMHLDPRARLLYLGAGSLLHVASLHPTVCSQGSFSTVKQGQPRELINQLTVQGKYVHVTKKGQSRLEMWHLEKHRLQRSVDLNDFMSKSGEIHQHARVTSMVLVGKSTLWLGTGEGAIVLIDSSTYQHIITMSRHSGTIRSLLCARVFDQFSAVISGGLGFSGDTQSHEKDDDDHGYLTIWDPDIPQHKHAAEEYERRRQDWFVRNQRKTTEQAPAAEPTSQGQGHPEVKLTSRRTSMDMMARLGLGKNKQTQLEGSGPRRRHSQIPGYDKQEPASPKSAEADPGTALKRASLTPNLEYVKLKRASVHGAPGAQSTAARQGEAIKKRASLQHSPFSLDSGASVYESYPGRERTLEIGKILKMRKRGSTGGLGGSPREQRGMLGIGQRQGSVSPTLETVNQEESNL